MSGGLITYLACLVVYKVTGKIWVIQSKMHAGLHQIFLYYIMYSHCTLNPSVKLAWHFQPCFLVCKQVSNVY